MILNINDFELFTTKNLKIRHLIADLLPLMDDNERKRYLEFFRYTERLEKRTKYKGV